jgi:heat-inducible transcriptional repressor
LTPLAAGRDRSRVGGHDVEALSERQREILTAIIEDYIATAEPIGSRTLTRRRALDLSPATVRNAMADLEELGFLSAPHASAGRLPTPAAFRIYVERLAQRGRITARERELIQALAQGGATDFSALLREAGRVLSLVSRHAALVLLPSLDEVVFRQIDFVPVRDSALVAVFVAKSGLVQNRLLEVPFKVDRDELVRMSNYLNSLLGGKTLAEVRGEIVRAMADERLAADGMMRNALILGERTLRSEVQQSVVLEGERTFLDQPEFADIEKMRRLLRAFEEKTVLLRLLDAATTSAIGASAASSAETTVLLGSESSVKEARDLAVVTSIYSSDQGPAGRVGVVGPTRMDYARVIPLVELTADALSQSLSDGPRPPAGVTGGGRGD